MLLCGGDQQSNEAQHQMHEETEEAQKLIKREADFAGTQLSNEKKQPCGFLHMDSNRCHEDAKREKPRFNPIAFCTGFGARLRKAVCNLSARK
jgi:hypothetical protein